jgi:chromosome segregation ATPase
MTIDPTLAQIIIAILINVPVWLSLRASNRKQQAEAEQRLAEAEAARLKAQTDRKRADTEDGSADVAAVDRLSAALSSMGMSYVDLVGRISASVQQDNAGVITELRGRIKALEDAQRELQRELVIKDGKLAESEREISNLSSQLAQARGEIGKLNARNKEYEIELAQVREQLTSAQRQIIELQNK